ncbi:indole-3-glycerol phosphate synthase TrpC [Ulvibacter litoralis]|uniref:Indole-3-glycerol phosphate synthase n=1 Tax=Ulvibacter litoralis TaxID=227084 RepID=A0A1G7J0E8_9FLAO|nr:indole-3-glycerol phosphate synthase TrpC [Ulvibacter litoralis]GHC60402.1 indole-3-glycerol phosphate synthase [Ulvibacter litoralis]SDF18371.1 indole-3-glycerol phosphate synthase [Ulvibacter litoralis]
MNILDQITAQKTKEVSAKKEAFPIKSLELSTLFERETVSLATALRTAPIGIIAEHKRRSPSKSVINDKVLVQDVAVGYEKAGVSGMSVLTDTPFFGGSLDDLLVARKATSFPILRKEFIIDPYQIYEAKAYGADAILLIAAILDAHEIKLFSSIAKNLQLDVLLEVHNQEELEKSLFPTIDMIGVNNRNLKTFEVSLETSKSLSKLIPSEFVKVSESGISSIENIKALKEYGFQGFLIGENFMKTENPGASALQFMKQL